MGEIVPICRGALYRDVGGTDTHGELIRVKSVWIDEDGNTQIQVFTEKPNSHTRSRTVDQESFIHSINDAIIRVNTDHEAWEWRN